MLKTFDLSAAYFCCKSTILSQNKDVLLDSDPVTGKAAEEQWTASWHVFVTSLPRKHSPPLAWTIDTRQIWSMDSCCFRQILSLTSECLSRNCDSSDLRFSRLQLVWWACAHCSLSFLFLDDRTGTWHGLLLPSASRFNMCILRSFSGHHNCTQLSVYLSCCSLSVNSNQSGHSPLTSLNNKMFLSAELPLTRCFFDFRFDFWVNSSDCVRENSRRSAVYVMGAGFSFIFPALV